ncbi:hypothetical protein AV540_09955 [Brevibacillus parabrevis]|uniref:DUF2877 domain-containing protein n=1 Tax=Brevibacillus parabrevis TaxID=54914 RepID=UPI0007AC0D8B|nr:DUF2877 domain-containing protein [Brevibacillus parabrevis]KZE52192.1 hypothetical protein AV540_09955 [Brevibacillus parabrevis]
MRIQALSGDADFCKKLASSSFHGFVHSVFERTINLKCLDDNELYTIVCNKLDNGPNTLVIDLPSLSGMEVAEGDPVYGKGDELIVGSGVFICIRQATRWEAHLPSFPCNIDVLRENVAFMKQYVDAKGKTGGMKMSSRPASLFERETSRMLNERAEALSIELAKGNSESASEQAVRLVGLGPGLTPSGDDYLVGLCIVYKMQNIPCYLSCHFFEKVVELSRGLTNEISSITLKKAANGKVRESLVDLLRCLTQGSREELLPALEKVVGIGSSSGTDMALGLICGLERNLEAGGNVCLPKL